MVGQWIKESKIINNNFNARYLNLLASKSVDESGKISVGKLLGMIGLILNLIKEIIIHRPQQVYFALTTTGFAFYRDCVLVFLIKLFRINIIYHLHNKGVKKASESPINHWLYQKVFRNTKVILLSQYLYDDIENFVSQEQIRICPNGVPEIKELKSEDLERKNEIPQILFLSNLIESKGVYILLSALEILKNRDLKFEAIFVGGEGDISKEEFEKKVTALNLSKHVKYLGKKYGKEKEYIYKNANLFIFPTYQDCFPLVLLEAMQFSLPIISSSEGGIPDIVYDGENGIIVPQKDFLELSLAIEKLILNPKTSMEMGKKGRIKFLNKYILDKFEINLMNIIQKT
ncbi:glycosyl transferase [Cloacibacterium rupense]|uniref:Glycosyl transferase n=1 Tax=Cloacibacterium rupense TaxID=517423 RepID=A0ABQ2NG80_9FLAO|nr:glycosyltransferase family 4 protein [Cloacibacterium rupense]GGP01714.1 glycosyl transferase [Cloacibacterium rupense]